MSDLQSLVDFGMCVVVWLVQLVIYPSFLRVDCKELIDWHRRYTFRVSFVIMPLMLLQLVAAVYFALTQGNSIAWWVLGLVIVCWGLTFRVSVPLHRKLDQGDPSGDLRRKLIQTNWPRTVLWTAVCLLGLAESIYA